MKCLLLLLLVSPLLAHEAHHTAPSVPVAAPRLAETYRREIEPIFQKKCFDCHSTKTRYPWYYKLPGARQLIDYDTREAKEHIDMTDGFPFQGHHSLEDQLKDLGEVVEKNKMPLWRYRLLHPGSGLTRKEKETILNWLKTVP